MVWVRPAGAPAKKSAPFYSLKNSFPFKICTKDFLCVVKEEHITIFICKTYNSHIAVEKVYSGFRTHTNTTTIARDNVLCPSKKAYRGIRLSELWLLQTQIEHLTLFICKTYNSHIAAKQIYSNFQTPTHTDNYSRQYFVSK